MSDTNEALRRLVAQVGDGTDVSVGGTPVQARRLLSEAAVALADRATVVSVACPIGELSLSTMIAQLSGRLDLDDQDDAVLEAGLRRLRGDGQTVLTVLAPAGISRSALLYLQHVSRQSPRLVMVMYRAPALVALLDEAGFAALRARLHASPAIEFEAPAAAVASRRAAVVPAVLRSSPLSPPIVAKRRAWRPMVWTAAGLGIAAVIGIIWVGRGAPGAAIAGSRPAHADIPLVSAAVPLPVAAELALPDAAVAPSPSLATLALTNAARPAPIMLATLPAHPPAAAVARRELPRLARARPYWPAPRYQEPADYERERSWDGVSPIWVRRDPRRPDYLGTYAVGPNGVRVFQYDP